MTVNGALTVTRTKSPGRQARLTPLGAVGALSDRSTQVMTGAWSPGTMLDCVAIVATVSALFPNVAHGKPPVHG